MFAASLSRASFIVAFAIALALPADAAKKKAEAPKADAAPKGEKWVTTWAASVQGPYPVGNPSAQPVPPELGFIRRERFTPVFVLVEEGREIGRIRGYPGDTFFWGLLASLIERLDRGESAPPEPAAAPPPGATFGE